MINFFSRFRLSLLKTVTFFDVTDDHTVNILLCLVLRPSDKAGHAILTLAETFGPPKTRSKPTKTVSEG